MLVRNLRFLRMARVLLPHATVLVVWGIVAVVFHMVSHEPETFGLTDPWPARMSRALGWSDVGIPFGAIAALGSALAIFLGFRNNSAYDRWWEARKSWGALVNDSRSWCRQVLAWVEAGKGAAAIEGTAGEVEKTGETRQTEAIDKTDKPEGVITRLRRELVHRHLAFVHGLAMHLRKQPQLHATVAEYVPADEAERYASAPNVPTALLIEQGKTLARAREAGQIEHFRHLAMDEMLTRFSTIQGVCERIKNTPLPRQYDAFPRWFVYFYGAILPLGLAEPIGWGAVPISASITLLFLALEASGRSIENPFENMGMDTPMTALAVTIERDLRHGLGEPIPEAVTPDERGVLL